VNFNKVAVRHQASCRGAFRLERRDKCGQCDYPRFKQQFGCFADTADVFLAVCIAKVQVAAQAPTHIVAVQNKGI